MDRKLSVMRKLALVVTILSASAALTFAGSEPSSGKEMKQVVPPPPACPSWAGFYIGGFGGYKFVNADIAFDLSGHWNDRDVAPAGFMARKASRRSQARSSTSRTSRPCSPSARRTKRECGQNAWWNSVNMKSLIWGGA